jgi:hypothetical protein
MLSRKADNPGGVQVSPGQPRSYDSFLLTGLATKRVLPGVRTSYPRGMGKLPATSAYGRLLPVGLIATAWVGRRSANDPKETSKAPIESW